MKLFCALQYNHAAIYEQYKEDVKQSKSEGSQQTIEQVHAAQAPIYEDGKGSKPPSSQPPSSQPPSNQPPSNQPPIEAAHLRPEYPDFQMAMAHPAIHHMQYGINKNMVGHQ